MSVKCQVALGFVREIEMTGSSVEAASFAPYGSSILITAWSA